MIGFVVLTIDANRPKSDLMRHQIPNKLIWANIHMYEGFLERRNYSCETHKTRDEYVTRVHFWLHVFWVPKNPPACSGQTYFSETRLLLLWITLHVNRFHGQQQKPYVPVIILLPDYKLPSSIIEHCSCLTILLAFRKNYLLQLTIIRFEQQQCWTSFAKHALYRFLNGGELVSISEKHKSLPAPSQPFACKHCYM